jgi:hypothetical protein
MKTQPQPIAAKRCATPPPKSAVHSHLVEEVEKPAGVTETDAKAKARDESFRFHPYVDPMTKVGSSRLEKLSKRFIDSSSADVSKFPCLPSKDHFNLCCVITMVVTNMSTLALIGMFMHLTMSRSESVIVSNPVANPSVITPFVWILTASLVLVHPYLFVVLIYRCVSDLRTHCRSRWQKLSCVLVIALRLSAVIFPAGMMILFANTAGFNCAHGFPGFAKGGFCRCDARPLLSSRGTPKYVPIHTAPKSVTIAFVGDMDNENVQQVYNLIRKENVSAVVLNGDLDYQQRHKNWKDRFESFLGDTPFFVTVGNHDTATWRDYQEKTQEHYVSSNVTECSGSIGVREECTHKGLGLLLSGVGSSCGGLPAEHTPFFKETLQRFAVNNVTWRICLFHKNQRKMQTGSKSDAVGWDKYETCMRHGAMILTSHEHAYARTHELDQISEGNIRISRQVPKGSSPSNAIRVGQGSSFVVMNGLGGGSVRRLKKERVADPWWAATWGGSDHSLIPQGVDNFGQHSPDPTHGVFFCTYHVMGDPRLARCHMKDVLGRLVDEFYVRSTV